MAVLSFDATVLLMMKLFVVSSNEIPPPAKPATLFTIMLLLRLTCQRPFELFQEPMSAPLTCWGRHAAAAAALRMVPQEQVGIDFDVALFPQSLRRLLRARLRSQGRRR